MAEAAEWTGADGIIRRRRADGTMAYRWTWRDGGTRNGARRSFTRDRLGDAKALKAAIIANGYRLPETEALPAAVGAPVARRATGPTFAEYGAKHIANLTGVGPGWRTSNVRDLERHMLPAFGDLELTDLDEAAVRTWLRGMEAGTHPWLRGRALAPRTRRRLVSQAGAILNAAVTDGLLPRNPFRGVRIGREDHDRHEEQVVLDHDEWQLLRRHLPAGVPRAVADVLIATGARWSEITALAVGHVVTDPAPAVRITRSWQSDGANGWVLGATKSRKSRRTVEIGASTLTGLRPYLDGHAEDQLLFTGRQGGHVRAQNYWSRVWTPAVTAAQADGLGKRPRIHDLRHTHVSWLIAAGVPLAVIQRRLGHDSITTTIDTYGHMLPAAEAAAVSAIEAALGGSGNSEEDVA